MKRIELIGETISEYPDGENIYLFAYLPAGNIPKEYRDDPSLWIAFYYVKQGDKEKKTRVSLLGSITAHDPYIIAKKPVTVFTEEELEHIALLLTGYNVLPSSYKRDAEIVPIKKRNVNGKKEFIFAYVLSGEVINWGFIYSQSDKIRYGDFLIDALIANSKCEWQDTKEKFTDQELKDIKRLKIENFPHMPK